MVTRQCPEETIERLKHVGPQTEYRSGAGFHLKVLAQRLGYLNLKRRARVLEDLNYAFLDDEIRAMMFMLACLQLATGKDIKGRLMKAKEAADIDFVVFDQAIASIRRSGERASKESRAAA
jgi:hypothetical protein